MSDIDINIIIIELTQLGKTKPSNEIRFGMQIGVVKNPKSTRRERLMYICDLLS